MRFVLRIMSVLIMGVCVVAVPAFAGSVPTPVPAKALNVAGTGTDAYAPPPCVAGVPFADVTCTTFYDAWIEQFARDGITSGCGNGDYCPNENVTRAQMAVFVEAAMHGTGNWPAHTQLVWAVKAADGSPDPVASGTALLNAAAAIPTSGNDAPSATNPWLLKVGPGIFDLGSGGLSLPPWVELDGAGMSFTTITAANDTWYTVFSSGGNTVSNVTITNWGSGANTYGIYVDGTTLTLDHVYVEAEGGSSHNVGVLLNDAWLDLYDGVIVSDWGVYTAGGQYHAVQAWRTLFSCSADTYNYAGYEIDLAYTRVPDSLVNNGPGVYKCIGNYDFNLAPVTCP
jgi:hypothetical protein